MLSQKLYTLAHEHVKARIERLERDLKIHTHQGPLRERVTKSLEPVQKALDELHKALEAANGLVVVKDGKAVASDDDVPDDICQVTGYRSVSDLLSVKVPPLDEIEKTLDELRALDVAFTAKRRGKAVKQTMEEVREKHNKEKAERRRECVKWLRTSWNYTEEQANAQAYKQHPDI